MRDAASRAIAVLLSLVAVGALAASTTAQPPKEEFERPFLDEPVTGYERSDDIVVLDDESFCSHLLGLIWADRELTFLDLINKSRQQKPAKREAFAPVSDEATLAACVSGLNAFREEPSTGDGVADWAREHAVIPEALAAFLPVDVETDPLATPPPPGDGARTAGFGSRTSAPFTLWDGDYYIEPDTGTCGSWSGAIRRVDDSSELASVTVATNVYDVAMAHYYWDVTTDDCDWTVDITAMAPLPDPTPTPLPMATVPRLVGSSPWDPTGPTNPEWLTVEAALQAILDAGLVVGGCTEAFDLRVPPGYLLAQDPAPGTVVEFGSAVNVVMREGGPGCGAMTGS